MMKLLFAIILLSILPVDTFSQLPKEDYDFHVYTWEEVIHTDSDTIYAITFAKQKLKTLPRELLRFQELIYLDLEKNKLIDLPKKLDTLKNLEYLNISKNKFTRLPHVISRLYKLEYLIASRNQIEKIPNTIEYCTELKKIDLWDNPISSIPNSFFTLSNLSSLDLSGIRFNRKSHKKITEAFGHINLQIDAPCDCMD